MANYIGLTREEIVSIVNLLHLVANYGQVGRIVDNEVLRNYREIYRKVCLGGGLECNIMLDPTLKRRVRNE